MRENSGNKNQFLAPWDLFPYRITSPARAKMALPFKPLPDSLKREEIEVLLLGSPISENRVLYVHLPFCKHLCSFCGYYKEIYCDTDLIDRYIAKLTSQLQFLQTYRWVSQQPFQSIYFGGGSPSSLNKGQISSLLRSVEKYIPMQVDCEITMELTAGEISADFIMHLVSQGINRVSIGVQTFNTGLRQKLGRKSTGERVCEAIKTCHDAGISNLCIDLIYNLPGQTLSLWESDLQLISTLPVTGCSVYPLIPFPNSPLVVSGGFHPQNSEEEYGYFKMADDYLLALADWTAFTPVQFGHRSLGEPNYIRAQGLQTDLLALGPSAGGRINQYQYLSKYSLENCFTDGFDFLVNSSWSSINSNYLKYKSLYSISEGSGISDDELKQAGFLLKDLLPGIFPGPCINAAHDHYTLGQPGRFWAGNISSQISARISEKLI